MTPATVDSLLPDLQAALGDAYAVEHELGVDGICLPARPQGACLRRA